jgi:hypothetical protein
MHFMNELLNQIQSTKGLHFLESNFRIPHAKFPKVNLTSTSPFGIMPPKNLIIISVYLILFWLEIGGVYLLTTKNIYTIGVDGNGNILWFNYGNENAFIIESIIGGLLIFTAGLGFILLYVALQHSFNYPYGIKMILIGLMCIGIAFGLLQWILKEKIPPDQRLK